MLTAFKPSNNVHKHCVVLSMIWVLLCAHIATIKYLQTIWGRVYNYPYSTCNKTKAYADSGIYQTLHNEKVIKSGSELKYLALASECLATTLCCTSFPLRKVCTEEGIDARVFSHLFISLFIRALTHFSCHLFLNNFLKDYRRLILC